MANRNRQVHDHSPSHHPFEAGIGHQTRTILGDPDRFIEKYWTLYKKQGWYLTGNSAKMDEDGYVWIIGRVLIARALGQEEGDLSTLEE